MASDGWHSNTSPNALKKKSAQEGLGPNPTDRGRSGCKIHIHVDGKGAPFAAVITGANIYDSRLVSATFEKALQFGDHVWNEKEMNLCLDKGYDFKRVNEEVFLNGFTPHIRSRKEEKKCKENGAQPRRWVVERSIAWLKGFRTIRIRYCCYLSSFMAMVYLAMACILWNKL